MKHKEYVDFEFSKAFAVVDHQIANIYLKSYQDTERIVNILKNNSDIDIIITGTEKKFFNIDHEPAETLLLSLIVINGLVIIGGMKKRWLLLLLGW